MKLLFIGTAGILASGLSRFNVFATKYCAPLALFLLAFLALFAGGVHATAAEIILLTPSSVVEGAGTLTNVAQVRLAGPATSDTVVSLSAGHPLIIIPAQVTIPTGASNALFSITVGDNLLAEPDRPFQIVASFDGATATSELVLKDNDPDRMRFAGLPAFVDTNSSLALNITALNADGSVQTNLTRALSIIAEDLNGSTVLTEPSSVNFGAGRALASIRMLAPGRAVRIRCVDYPGTSDAFNVVPPAFCSVPQMVSDIAWHAASQTLLATVPASASNYANCIVAIDPGTGLVTSSYPVGFDPGQMELSPTGNYLYLTLSNRLALQRFDLGTRTAGIKFGLGAGDGYVLFAWDFCVPPNFADSVVVLESYRSDYGSEGPQDIKRYNSGAGTLLPNFFAHGGYQMETLASGYDVVLSPPLARANALNGTISKVNDMAPGTTFSFRGGRLYESGGAAFTPDTLGYLGNYPEASGLVDADPSLRRVFFLSCDFNYGFSTCFLRTYDRDLFQMVSKLEAPHTYSTPTRLLRVGTNGLAYVMNDGQLWFVRPEVVQPLSPAADVSLSVSPGPGVPQVGADYQMIFTASNAGPGTASYIRITNALPPYAAATNFLASSGNVSVSDGAFTWTVAPLGPGTKATLQVAFRFANGGWQTNTTCAVGFDPDPIYGNNSVTLPLYVQLPPAAPGGFAVNCSTEDILYDPVRDRLLLCVGDSLSSQSNGLAVFNQYNGTIESFTPLGKRPTRMVRTSDGQQLYVATFTASAGSVRRLSMPDFSQNLEFPMGTYPGAGIGQVFPLYARDMVASPNDPNTVAIVRSGSPYTGSRNVALYQNGVLRTNVVEDPTRNVEIACDTDTRTLYGLSTSGAFGSGSVLSRLNVTSDGLSIAETFPGLSSVAGSKIRYAGGRLFTPVGRSIRPSPFGVDAIHAGTEYCTLVEPDGNYRRVFYLTLVNTTASVLAYDMDNWRPLGSLNIQNVLGTPGALIRWGSNGLAFRTSDNLLYVIRHPLVQPAAESRLALSLQQSSSSTSVSNDVTFTLSITNSGPSASPATRICTTVSPGGIISSPSTAVGDWTNAAGNLLWSVPALAAGARATISFSLQSAQPGMVTVISSLPSGLHDPETYDNTAIALLNVGPLTANQSKIVYIPTLDVVWAGAAGRFYMTASTNLPNGDGLLMSFDPESLEVRPEAQLGPGAGRLALDSDGTRLYAALSYGVEERAVPGSAFVRRYLLGNLGAPETTSELKALPSSPGSIALLRGAYGYNAEVVVFENGIARTNAAACYNDSDRDILETGDDPSRLYVLNNRAGGFQRYDVDSTGTRLIDSDATLFPSGSYDLDFARGLMYASSGRVVDPSNRSIIGTMPSIPANSRVLYERSSDRVLFVSPTGVLRAYDGPTLLPVGTESVVPAPGAPASFVQWGQTRFAFSTSDRVVLFSTPMVPTNAPADLALELTHSPAPHVAGRDIVASIVITNSGPNPATAVTWADTLPVGFSITDAQSSSGSCVISSNTVSGLIPEVEPGGVATIDIHFKSPAPGIFTNQVVCFSSAVDPAFENNSGAALLWVQPTNGLGSTVTLNLPLKDLERDPVRPLLYASFGSTAGPLADSIVAIDPVTGTFGDPVRIGSDPGILCASPDGQFIYAGLDGSGAIQKLALPGLTPVDLFPVPQNQRVVSMAVSPKDPNTLVIRRSPAGKTCLLVNGVPRAKELTDQDVFAFSDTTGELFGCDGYHSNVKLYRLDTTLSGLALLEGQPAKQGQVTELKSSGGLLFYPRGMILNPATATVSAILPLRWGAPVEPDAACGRVFYLTSSGTNRALAAFDIAQGIEVASVPAPPMTGTPRRLLRWGSDGLVTYSTNSQIVIWRGLLVPTNPATDVVLSQRASVDSVFTNVFFNLSLQVTNASRAPATGLVITQEFSIAVSNVTLVTTNGSASWTNNAVTWLPGNLDAGNSAALQVTLKVTRPGTLSIAAAARHDQNDQFWGDNFALTAVNVTTPAGTNVVEVRMPATDIEYDPYRDLIYATTPASNRVGGNLVAVIDPKTGSLKRALPAGSEPAQLTLSRDGSVLHVALNGALAVQRFTMPSGQRDLAFRYGTNDTYYAQDLEVSPADAGIVAASLCSYNLASGYPSDVLLYNNGGQLPLKGNAARGLVFSSSGSELFGSVSPGSSWSFVRMRVGPEGIASRDLVPGFTTGPGNLKYDNGRLYSSGGQVADPSAGVLLASLPASGAVAVDGSTARAFYLTKRTTTWELRAFDLTTLKPTGTQVVAGVFGSPTNLVRCGSNRLAFLTTSNQLFIVSSSLAVTNPVSPANLTVTQRGEQDFTADAETLRFIITVTNQGPSVASNMTIAICPPKPVLSASLAFAGMSTCTNGNFICTVPALSPGASTAILLSTVITNTSDFTNFVSVTSGSPDPALGDNTSSLTIHGLFFQRRDSYSTIPVASTALAYDPVRRRILVGMANALAWYDPETGSFAGQTSIGLTPTTMLVTDDGQYLYAFAWGAGLVQRVHLPSMTTNLDVNIPGASIVAMTTIPQSPGSFAMTYYLGGQPITAVFDDGVQRSSTVNDLKCTILACSSDGTSLFGYANTGTGGDSPDVFRMVLNSSGLTRADNGPTDTPGYLNHEMVFAAGRLFFASGHILNPSTWTEEPSLETGGSSITAAQSVDRLGILSNGFDSYIRLFIIGITNRVRLAEITFPYTPWAGDHVTYCGADRWAFRTTAAIYVVRSSTTPAADLTLRSAIPGIELNPGGMVPLQLTISNSGPATAFSLLLSNTLPAGFTVVSNQTTAGSVVVQGDTVLCNIDSLLSNATARVTLSISPAAGCLGWATNLAALSASGAPDPILFNNRSDLPLLVVPLDTDHDGLPDDYEFAHGLSPTNSLDAVIDSDCDGLSNLEEYRAGSDPMVFGNVRLSAVRFEAGNFELSAHGALGKLYTIEASPDLVNWSSVGSFRCTESNQPLKVQATSGRSFFRLRTDSTPGIPLLSIQPPSTLSTNAPRVVVFAPAGQGYSLQTSGDLIRWTELTNFFSSSCETPFKDSSGSGASTRYYRVLRTASP